MSYDSTVTDLDPVPPPARGGRIRVRGHGSPAWAKLLSFFLSLPLLAATLVGVEVLTVGLIRLGTTPAANPAAGLFLTGLAVTVAAALVWAALSRLSSLGPTVCGLGCLTLGVTAFFRVGDVLPPMRRLARLLPLPGAEQGALELLTTATLPTLGALLLALALSASLGRRAARYYRPDALGL